MGDFDDFCKQAQNLSNILNGPSKIDQRFLKGLWDASEGGDPSARVERAVNQMMAALEKGEVPEQGKGGGSPQNGGGAATHGGGSSKAFESTSHKSHKKDKKHKKDGKDKDISGDFGTKSDFGSFGNSTAGGGNWGAAPQGFGTFDTQPPGSGSPQFAQSPQGPAGMASFGMGMDGGGFGGAPPSMGTSMGGLQPPQTQQPFGWGDMPAQTPQQMAPPQPVPFQSQQMAEPSWGAGGGGMQPGMQPGFMGQSRERQMDVGSSAFGTGPGGCGGGPGGAFGPAPGSFVDRGYGEDESDSDSDNDWWHIPGPGDRGSNMAGFPGGMGPPMQSSGFGTTGPGGGSFGSW